MDGCLEEYRELNPFREGLQPTAQDSGQPSNTPTCYSTSKCCNPSARLKPGGVTPLRLPGHAALCPA